MIFFLCRKRFKTGIFLVYFACFGCGSRRKIDSVQPDPVSRGGITFKQNPWERNGAVNSGVSGDFGNNSSQNDHKFIKIFFIKSMMTASDSEDYSVDQSIQSWFGFEPVDLRSEDKSEKF